MPHLLIARLGSTDFVSGYRIDAAHYLNPVQRCCQVSDDVRQGPSQRTHSKV